MANLDELTTAIEPLMMHLSKSGDRLVTGDVAHGQHYEFVERTWSLHHYLRSALGLAQANTYGPAFVLLRSAMEHHVVDHLLFLGDRFRAIAKDVSDETLGEWRRAIAGGERGPDVLDVRRRGDRDAEVIRTGVHFEGQDRGPSAPSLSIYYGILDQYDPFTGGWDAQPHIGDWLYRRDARRRHVANQAMHWKLSLSWKALMANVQLNGFYADPEVARWHVHYSFLSAFAHPVSRRALSSVYGRNMPRAVRADHYVRELVLLYVGTLAGLELEAFDAMTQREPKVGLRDGEAVANDINAFRKMASHLWFPTGPPTPFDRVQEANQRGMLPDRSGFVPREDRQPESFEDEAVRYYENPLKRLIEMHAGINEITGFQWASPWPEPDARWRLLDC